MIRKRQPPFSVIIPTLWKPATFIQLLKNLDQSEDVLEILVIDNARANRPQIPDLTKIHIIDKGENLYANPSWNLGVSLAKSKAICLCNDDVLIADNLLSIMRSRSLRLITGLDPTSYGVPLSEAVSTSLTAGAKIKQNWGSILFFRKSKYCPIPDDLKIWWGDAWLAQEMGPAKQVKTAVYTKHSESAGSPEFTSIIASDTQLWHTRYLTTPSILRRIHKRILHTLLSFRI